jgi:hypothetical protein
VHDLAIHDNDLIAATVGRAIWVLDDLSPLRQQPDSDGKTPMLHAPAAAVRLRANDNRDTPFTPETPLGQNPPTGAMIDYFLPETVTSEVALEVRDAAGVLIRRFSSSAVEPDLESSPYFTADWLKSAPALSTAAGPHRFVWNLRMERPKAIEYQYSNTASRSEGAELTPQGPLVLPGDYRVTLLVGGERYEQPLRILPDPRVTVSGADAEASVAFAKILSQDLYRVWRAYAEIGAIRRTLLGDLDRARSRQLPGAVGRLEGFDRLLRSLTDGDREETLSLAANGDVLANLATDVEGSDRRPTASQLEVRKATSARVEIAVQRWRSLQDRQRPVINRELSAWGLNPLMVPDAVHLRSAAAPEGSDLP